MSSTPLTNLLLIDSLQRTLVNPTSSLRWHVLLDYYRLEENPDLKLRVRSALQNGVPRNGVTGFLLATFLFEVTGEMAYLDEAGLIVQQIRPLDPDRLMALVVFLWGHFISRSADREHFVATLRVARMHEVAALLEHALGAQPKATLPQRPITAIKRVALVASYIGQESHAPTPLALQHAKLLMDLGYQVHLFSAQELRVQEMQHYLGNNNSLATYTPDVMQLRKVVPAGMGLTLSDERFSLARRWKDLLASIAGFDPDLIMFVGLNSPLLAPLFESRPVLGLCVHSTPPMAPVDVWLNANQSTAGRMSTVWGPSIPDAWGHYHPFRVKLKPKDEQITRAELGLRDTALVLISVGARLHHEITGEWASRICELLARHPEVQWLLIGGAGLMPPALEAQNARTPEQLKVLLHHESLRSVMSNCDIYVNPPRVGGGFSVAEAMAEGLAVTALANSDGGDKIGAAASADLDAYFAQLEKLITDASFRRDTGTALQTLFHDTLDLDKSGPSLLAACELALQRFTLRKMESSA